MCMASMFEVYRFNKGVAVRLYIAVMLFSRDCC